MLSVASMKSSGRDVQNATIFLECAFLILEKIASEIHGHVGGCYLA